MPFRKNWNQNGVPVRILKAIRSKILIFTKYLKSIKNYSIEEVFISIAIVQTPMKAPSQENCTTYIFFVYFVICVFLENGINNNSV